MSTSKIHIIKTIFCLLLLTIQANLYGNIEHSYKCENLNNQSIRIVTKRESRPMFFQKSKTSITHFTIFAANEEITKFIIYKFNNNLHIVDSRIKTLNPNYDIILFSLPHKKYFSFNFPGIFENGKFIFIRSLTINKESFYTYEVEAEKKKINVSQIIFDKNLVPVEFDLTNGSAVCNCTKSKIIIRLN